MTYYLILLLALGVAGLGLFVRQRSDAAGLAMIVAGTVGCVACIGWQVRQTLFTPEQKGPDRGQAVVSYYLANRVLGELGGEQDSVVLFFPPDSVMDEETVGTYAGTFNRVLRPFGRIKVESVTLAVRGKDAKSGRIPLSAFQQAASNLPPALIYVSFAGVPPDIDKFSPGRRSRFYVFDPWGTSNWLAPMKNGFVATAIVPRPGVRNQEVSGEPNDVFNQLYLLATRSTADEVAAKLAGK